MGARPPIIFGGLKTEKSRKIAILYYWPWTLTIAYTCRCCKCGIELCPHGGICKLLQSTINQSINQSIFITEQVRSLQLVEVWLYFEENNKILGNSVISGVPRFLEWEGSRRRGRWGVRTEYPLPTRERVWVGREKIFRIFVEYPILTHSGTFIS